MECIFDKRAMIFAHFWGIESLENGEEEKERKRNNYGLTRRDRILEHEKNIARALESMASSEKMPSS